MRIAAPLSRVEEAEPLARAGADEMYCGVLSREWEERFGILTANRRVHGNLSSMSELRRVVEISHSLGKTVSLTLNAQHYSSEQCVYIVALGDELAEMGLDAVIVSDVGLLQRLSREGFPFRVHVSSLASCHNSEAISFFADLGVTRVILPRHVLLEEVAEMASRAPSVELEVFVLNDGCVFEEGSCHTLHLPPQMGGPLCLDRYTFEHVRADGRELTEDERVRLEAQEREYRSWLWFNFGCGFSQTEEGLPYGPCGLCAIPSLLDAGIVALKVVGREANAMKKIQSVQMVRAVLDLASTSSKTDILDFAQGLRGERNRCQPGYMCYYRDAFTLNGGVKK